MLSVELFGFVEVHVDDVPIQKHPSRSLLSLLAYLIIYRERIHPRESLAETFWSEHNRAQSRKCLNTALWRLRSLLIDSQVSDSLILSTPDGGVFLNCARPHWFDVEEFETEARLLLRTPPDQASVEQINRLRAACRLYRGDLLEGFYEDWILRERERLRQMYLASQVYTLQYYRLHEDFAEGISTAQDILSVEPLREDVHRMLMQLYARSGQRAQVIQQYRRCEEFLRDELGVEPMPETTLLYQSLLHEEEPHGGGRATAPGAPPQGSVVGGEIRRLRMAVERMNQTQQDVQRALARIEAALQDYSRSDF